MIPPRSDRRQRPDTQRAVQREATKAALLAAARKLFTERGYEAVSVADIGKEAGLSPSLINVYFGTKGGLLYEMVKAQNEPQFEASRQASRAAPTPLERLAEVFRVWAAADLAEPRLAAAMQALSWTWPLETELANAADRRRGEVILGEIVQAGMESGAFRPAPVAEVVNSLWAIYTWGLRPCVFGQATVAECVARMVAEARNLLVARGG